MHPGQISSIDSASVGALQRREPVLQRGGLSRAFDNPATKTQAFATGMADSAVKSCYASGDQIAALDPELLGTSSDSDVSLSDKLSPRTGHALPSSSRFAPASPDTSAESWISNSQMLREGRKSVLYHQMPTEISSLLIASARHQSNDIQLELDKLLLSTAHNQSLFEATITELVQSIDKLKSVQAKQNILVKFERSFRALPPIARFHAFTRLADVVLSFDDKSAEATLFRLDSYFSEIARVPMNQLRERRVKSVARNEI